MTGYLKIIKQGYKYRVIEKTPGNSSWKFHKPYFSRYEQAKKYKEDLY